jgi:hypothetical protein
VVNAVLTAVPSSSLLPECRHNSNLQSRSRLRLEPIPDEIWNEIFKYLPHDALIRLHIADSQLHRIARPLLFREFNFHPYGIMGQGNTMECHPSAFALPQEQHVVFLSQPLQYWSSKEIAPFVRACRITPWYFTAEPYRSLGWEIHKQNDPFAILISFFRSLTRLTNLHHLFARYVPFHSAGIQGLSLLLQKLAHFEDNLLSARSPLIAASWFILFLSNCASLHSP